MIMNKVRLKIGPHKTIYSHFKKIYMTILKRKKNKVLKSINVQKEITRIKENFKRIMFKK